MPLNWIKFQNIYLFIHFFTKQNSPMFFLVYNCRKKRNMPRKKKERIKGKERADRNRWYCW